MSNFFASRLQKLQSLIPHGQILLVSRSSDVFYFTSFFNNMPEERGAFLLVTSSDAKLILPNFVEKPEHFAFELYFGNSSQKLTQHLKQCQEQWRAQSIALDLPDLRVDEFQAISQVSELKIANLDRQLIWQLRQVKDEGELTLIKQAQAVTARAIDETLAQLQIGQSELEVEQILNSKLRADLHCDLAFPSIVAFDEHSATPHHFATDKRLEDGSVVLIDAGAKYMHYCGDMTRTIFFEAKKAKSDAESGALASQLANKKAKFAKILEIVRTAQDATKKMALEAFKFEVGEPKSEATENNGAKTHKLTFGKLDNCARSIIHKAGYGNHFVHTTGHGLGLDIHEPPSIFKTNTAPLLPGMAITVEPGIYLEGEFGVRWEDVVVLR